MEGGRQEGDEWREGDRKGRNGGREERGIMSGRKEVKKAKENR